MSITAREVINKRNSDGIRTGKPGTVYDVDFKINISGEYKRHIKKGFLTKREAQDYEAAKRTEILNPTELLPKNEMRVRDYMPEWLERHRMLNNLQPSTYASYKSIINIHIIPEIGAFQIRAVTKEILEDFFKNMFDTGCKSCTVKNIRCVLSGAFESARKNRYINYNPARDVEIDFGKQGKTPAPYTIPQLQQLMGYVSGTEWELPVMLAGMYGMRLGEIFGLRWCNVDLNDNTFIVKEQLPFRLPNDVTIIREMALMKSEGRSEDSKERILPITEAARPYFERHFERQRLQRELMINGGGTYYENDLVIAKPNGVPHRKGTVSSNFGQMIRRSGLQRLRFHDLRHTAATNVHELSSDFFAVSAILGHSLKGVGIQLGISNKLDSVTANYIHARTDKMKDVLEPYHNLLHLNQ